MPKMASIEEWLELLKITVDEVGGLSSDVRGIFTAPRGHRLVIINRDLPYQLRNEVYWHEIAHALLGHDDLVSLCTVDSWWRSKLERDAERRAACLALPNVLLARFGVVPDQTFPTGWLLPLRDDLLSNIADAADVTEEMVCKRLGLVDMRFKVWEG